MFNTIFITQCSLYYMGVVIYYINKYFEKFICGYLVVARTALSTSWVSALCWATPVPTLRAAGVGNLRSVSILVGLVFNQLCPAVWQQDIVRADSKVSLTTLHVAEFDSVITVFDFVMELIVGRFLNMNETIVYAISRSITLFCVWLT